MSNATRIVAPAATALALAAPAAQARPAVEAPNHNSPAYVAAPTRRASPTASTGATPRSARGGVLGLVALFSAGAAVAGACARRAHALA